MDIQTAVIALYPSAQFAGPKGTAGYEGIRWHKKPAGITKTEVLTKLAELQAAYPLQELREQRNVLLAETDWTGLADSALTSEVSAEWKLYRQRLRDLPSGLNTPAKVKAVKWPTKPV
tara:strand:- start:129 stop:482 length:354 start_codon:yes stop_codon:yes gene_type:complete